MKITLILGRYSDSRVEDYINHHHYTHIYDGMEAVNNAISNFVDEEDELIIYNIFNVDTINNLKQEHSTLKVLVATKEPPNEIMKQIKIDGFL